MSGYDLSRISMLVVDDNHYMRTLIKTILTAFHCRNVREAPDGVEAFKMMAGGFNPDIILTNWNMPMLDGIDFVRLVRTGEDSPNPFVPVIMVTGFSEHHRILAARDAGVNEFLVKPISAKVLYARLVNIISKPRPFVRTKTYFGPDRRRRASSLYKGPERRADAMAAAGGGLSEDQVHRLLSQRR